MPSTHLSLHYHIVFSTKDRARIISHRWRDDLHGYIGGIIKNIGGVSQAIGGVEDHVHLLIGLRATHCLSDVVRDIKCNSSGWANDISREKGFQWQEGYGAFTVSAHLTAQARGYIAKQEEHHRTRTFQEEYVDFLQCGMVEYEDDICGDTHRIAPAGALMDWGRGPAAHAAGEFMPALRAWKIFVQRKGGPGHAFWKECHSPCRARTEDAAPVSPHE